MTAVGYAALEDELRQRIGVERPRLIQRIRGEYQREKDMADCRQAGS
jgi:hypothetical protein